MANEAESINELVAMLDNKLSFPDVVLQLDKRRIYAHQAQLGTKSQWFAQLFTELRQSKEKPECDEEGIPILDITSKFDPPITQETFWTLLQFCYCNTLHVSNKATLEVLLAARTAQIWALVLYCEFHAVLSMQQAVVNILPTFVGVAECPLDPSLDIFGVLRMAIAHELQGVKRFCMEYISLHFETLFSRFRKECEKLDDDILDAVLDIGLREAQKGMRYLDTVPQELRWDTVTGYITEDYHELEASQFSNLCCEVDAHTGQACLLVDPLPPQGTNRSLNLRPIISDIIPTNLTFRESQSHSQSPLQAACLRQSSMCIQVDNIPNDWSHTQTCKFFSQCFFTLAPHSAGIVVRPMAYHSSLATMKAALWILDGMKLGPNVTLQWRLVE